MYVFHSIFCVCIIRVVSLNMSPINDSFLSGSLDKTIRLWDLRSQNCQVNCQLLYSLCKSALKTVRQTVNFLTGCIKLQRKRVR